MKFIRRTREEKLYKQWVKHGDLSPEAIPQKESPSDVPVGREEKSREEKGREENGQSLRMLYIMLGVSILVFCIGLVLLLAQLC